MEKSYYRVNSAADKPRTKSTTEPTAPAPLRHGRQRHAVPYAEIEIGTAVDLTSSPRRAARTPLTTTTKKSLGSACLLHLETHTHFCLLSRPPPCARQPAGTFSWLAVGEFANAATKPPGRRYRSTEMIWSYSNQLPLVNTQ